MSTKSKGSCGPCAADKEWEARYDAETLVRAAEITKDKDRLARAKAWAKKEATRLREAADKTAALSKG